MKPNNVVEYSMFMFLINKNQFKLKYDRRSLQAVLDNSFSPSAMTTVQTTDPSDAEVYLKCL